MKPAIFITVFIFLGSCSEGEHHASNSVDSTKAIDTHVQSIEFIDTTHREIPFDLYDSIITDVKLDTIVTGFVAIDSIINSYKQSKSTKREHKDNYCWGDCCGGYTKFTDKINRTKLFLFKNYCGQYGFYNYQFYFQNDTPRIVRFREFLSDMDTSAHTERVYFIQSDKALLMTRSISSK